jgi:hypothetical protein
MASEFIFKLVSVLFMDIPPDPVTSADWIAPKPVQIAYASLSETYVPIEVGRVRLASALLT